MKTKSPLVVILCLVLVAAWAGTASAQEVKPVPTEIKESPTHVIRQRPAYIDKIERLIRLGQFGLAADFAEASLQKHPEDISLKKLLMFCYMENKDFDKLVLFMGQRLATEPPGYPLFRDAGQAHLLAGDLDSADYYFLRSASYVLDREESLGVMADYYLQFGHYQRGAAFIDSLRVVTGNPALLPARRGDALSVQKKFAEATLEYLQYMERDSLAAQEGERRLISLIQYPESADTVMAILSGRIQTQTKNRRLLSTYGQLLLEQGRFGEAREFYTELDSLRGKSGTDILYFMRECGERGCYDQVIAAGEEMLNRLPQSSLAANARFVMARAYIAGGEYQQALEMYLHIAGQFQRASQKAEAFVLIGLLYKDYLKDFPRAAEYFQRVLTLSPRTRYGTQARYGLADLLIRQDRLDSAAALYEELLTEELPDDMAEECEFVLGSIDLFQGDYEDATGRFRAVIARYPRGFYVNDAIQYSLILNESLSAAASHLDLYSRAEYFRYIDEQDSLEFYLSKICRIELPALSPVSYLNLATLQFSQKRYDDALASIDSLAARYAESYFTPYGRKLKADIYMNAPDRQSEALDIYRGLLEEFPTYPFSAEIRDIVRRVADRDRI